METHAASQVYAEHLGALVQCPTIAMDDETGMDFAPFDALHRCLEELFPLVHRTLEREIVGKAALLYHWKGTGRSHRLPLLLMAHQDVLPAGEDALWDHPPFSGAIVGGRVWGRGASDCKSKLVAQMEALEQLIAQGWQPEYDLYLASGYNEELCGGRTPSGRLLADAIRAKSPRLGGVIDEGAGLFPASRMGTDRDVCAVAAAERGCADFEIYCEDVGGHGSRPRRGGPFVKLAQAILAIEEHPFPYRITDLVRERFRILAPYLKDRELADLVEHMDERWEDLVPRIDRDPDLAVLFQTSMVVTMAKGSDHEDAQPRRVSATVKVHPLQGDTLADVEHHLKRIVPEGVQVRLLRGRDPSPVSRLEGGMMDLIHAVRQEEAPGCLLLPDLFVGGTDAWYMYDLCDEVYRFSPFLPKDPPGQAHNVNESMGVASLASGVDFYIRLLQEYGRAKS